MPRLSAGLLLYRLRGSSVQVLLVHPGGPLWAKRDAGAWSIPKGEYDPSESPLAAARREFAEETGCHPSGPFHPLLPLRQPSGKILKAWAVEGDADSDAIRSNRFYLEWPPRSGVRREFPEIDRAGWFDLQGAREKLLPGQRPLVDQLVRLLQARESAQARCSA